MGHSIEVSWKTLSGMNLKVETVTTREGLEACSAEWNALLEQSAANTIFLTWEWISAWLDAVWPDAPLFVVAVRNSDGQLIALAPFYRARMRLLHLIDYRCLRIMGDRSSGGEYPDIIVHPDYEEQAIPLVFRTLLEHRDSWDSIWLPQITGWTGALQRFQSLCTKNSLHFQQRTADFGKLELPNTHEDYLGLLSANNRSNIRRHTKRLQAFGKVEFLWCEARDQLPELLETLFALHQLRWRTLEQDGCFVRQPLMVRFYKGFASVALQKGWLRLCALKLDGKIQAVQYGYAYHGTFYQLQEGFEPDATPGIGNVLRNFVIKSCIEEGLKEYDFLGEYTDHKRRWGAEQRFGHDLFIGRRTFKNGLLFAGEVWPTGRYLREDRLVCKET